MRELELLSAQHSIIIICTFSERTLNIAPNPKDFPVDWRARDEQKNCMVYKLMNFGARYRREKKTDGKNLTPKSFSHPYAESPF